MVESRERHFKENVNFEYMASKASPRTRNTASGVMKLTSLVGPSMVIISN